MTPTPKDGGMNVAGPTNCPNCGLDGAAYQRLGWVKQSIEFHNQALQSKLQEAQYINQCNAVRCKIYDELQVEAHNLKQEINNWRTGYSEQRTHLEQTKLQLAIAEQSLRYEKMANQATQKLLEEGQNATREIIAFLDTLGFPKASSGNTENVSIGTLWAENKAESRASRQQRGR